MRYEKKIDSYEYLISYDLQLFAENPDGEEKSEEPTAKKLQDARNKGQVAKSQDVPTALLFLIFFYFLRQLCAYYGERFMNGFHHFYDKIGEIVDDEFTNQLAWAYVGEGQKMVLVSLIPIFALTVAIAVISNVMQVKWKVTFEPMKPKLSKLNPISGAKKLFNKSKLFELLKSILKLTAIVVVVLSYLKDKWYLVMNMYSYTLEQAISNIGDVVVNIGLRISMIFCILAVVDFFYQKWKFHEDMKMTKKEVKDEFKNAEGDPKVKSQQRARMQAASRRRMMQEVPNADVVITNPTHLAVALKYDKALHEAPVVVAKGADYLAARIKEIAGENNIEIVENKPLARMLYHNVDLGAEIPPELYQMVAEVLAYVYRLRNE